MKLIITPGGFENAKDNPRAKKQHKDRYVEIAHTLAGFAYILFLGLEEGKSPSPSIVEKGCTTFATSFIEDPPPKTTPQAYGAWLHFHASNELVRLIPSYFGWSLHLTYKAEQKRTVGDHYETEHHWQATLTVYLPYIDVDKEDFAGEMRPLNQKDKP